MFDKLPYEYNAKTYRDERMRDAAQQRRVIEAADGSHTSTAFYAPVLALLGHMMASLGVWPEGRYSKRSHQHKVKGAPGYG